jgi:hypothetical protein
VEYDLSLRRIAHHGSHLIAAIDSENIDLGAARGEQFRFPRGGVIPARQYDTLAIQSIEDRKPRKRLHPGCRSFNW